MGQVGKALACLGLGCGCTFGCGCTVRNPSASEKEEQESTGVTQAPRRAQGILHHFVYRVMPSFTHPPPTGGIGIAMRRRGEIGEGKPCWDGMM